MRVRSAPALLLLPLLILLGTGLAGGRAAAADEQGISISQEEQFKSFLDRERKNAAEYTLLRAKTRPLLDVAYDEAAAEALAKAKALLEDGQVENAAETAVRALKKYPYALDAPGLTHQLFRCEAVHGDIARARLFLIRLRERFPEYADVNVAMREALLIAELVQARDQLIDLDADSPREVVKVENVKAIFSANMLFLYLVQSGDRHDVAPRATLGLARSYLVRGMSHLEKIGLARRTYERFLDSYPTHPLVFDALCEYALSYLVAYRGDTYDLGAVRDAESIIETQARFYTQEDSRRIGLIEKYRALIRRWWQERDLYVAHWYHNRGEFEQAAIYCREVIARDSQTAQAREAKRILESLPEPRTQ